MQPPAKVGVIWRKKIKVTTKFASAPQPAGRQSREKQRTGIVVSMGINMPRRVQTKKKLNFEFLI
jgi:hypothetical protein